VRSKSWSPELRSELGQVAFLAPTLVLLGILFVAPIGFGIWSSFLDEDRSTWTGLSNYAALLASSQFWHATGVSVTMTVAIVGGTYALGMLAALLLNRSTRGRTLIGAVFAIPWAIPYVAAAMVWAWMLDYQYGVLNYLVILLHLSAQPIGWLTESRLALVSVVIVEVWKLFPLAMVMLLAGLKGIPPELPEAATVDGARAFAIFRYITLPSLRPVTTVLLLILTIWVFGRAFTGVWVLTGGGPVDATTTLVILLYKTGFQLFHIHSAAALGTLMLVVSSCITAVYTRLVLLREA
jgi:multiple sugar transport system permease protein